MKEEFTEMEETEFQEMISGMLTDDDDWKYINIIHVCVPLWKTKRNVKTKLQSYVLQFYMLVHRHVCVYIFIYLYTVYM